MGKKSREKKERRTARERANRTISAITVAGADLEYERQLRATEHGQRSAELRAHGRAMVEVGDLEQAHAVLTEALRMAGADDSPAAASARHDLAKVHLDFADRRMGVPIEHVLEAETHLRRALDCPLRKRTAMRRMQTESLLSICLRRKAVFVPDEADELHGECERLLRSAIAAAESVGLGGSEFVAEYLQNLGTLLLRTGGDMAEAIGAYERALKLAKTPLLSDTPGPADHIRLNLASALAASDKAPEVARAKALFDGLLSAAGPSHAAEGALGLTRMLVNGTTDEHVRAVELMRGLNPAHVLQSPLRNVADLYRQTGLLEHGAERFDEFAEDAIRMRSGTISDHAADTASLPAQEAGRLAADLYLLASRPIEAFLALENTSGLRFAEELLLQCYAPSNPLSEVAWRRKTLVSTCAALLEKINAMLIYVGRSDLLGVLARLAHDMRANPTRSPAHADREVVSLVAAALDRASESDDPVDSLRVAAERFAGEGFRLEVLLRQHCHRYAKLRSHLGLPMTHNTLQSIVRETSGSILLRLHLAEELVGIGCWLDDGELVAASVHVPVSAAIREMIAAHDISKLDSGILRQACEQMSLRGALPEGDLGAVVVLPSVAASRLPIVGLGPAGERLVDRARSVVVVPSCTMFPMAPVVADGRSGTAAISTGIENFQGVAFGRELPDESVYTGDEATLERTLDLAECTQVLRFVVHGVHQGDSGPELALRNGARLNTGHLDSRWSGMARVELWACQSGVNSPTDPMTPPADEGYGLDYEFLRVGVRTAIGTLWSVRQYIAAFLLARFRSDTDRGTEPSEALVNAQRWWVTEGQHGLLNELRARPVGEAIGEYARSLKLHAVVDEQALNAMLGPTPSRPTEEQLDELRAISACPAAWGAFRFLGVAQQREPISPTKFTETELLAAEAELSSLLQPGPKRQGTFSERVEASLECLLARSEASLSIDDVLGIAGLYAARIRSDHRHNLSLALSYLHERLADDRLSSDEHQQLSLNAAHLWLDFALCGVPAELCVKTSAGKEAIARAEALVAGVTAPVPSKAASALVATTRIEWARSPEPDTIGALIGPLLDQAALTESELFDRCRCVNAVCEILLSSRADHRRAVRRTLDVAAMLIAAGLSSSDESIEAAVAKMRALTFLLGRRAGLTDRGGWPSHAALPASLVTKLVAECLFSLGAVGPDGRDLATELLSEALQQIENAQQGAHDGDHSSVFETAGCLGSDYRRLLAPYFSSVPTRDNAASHVLAGLHLAGDLRASIMNRIVVLAGAMAPDVSRVLEAIHEPTRYADLLSRCHLAATIGAGRPDRNANCADPYRQSSPEVLEATQSEGDLPAWQLAMQATRDDVDSSARTAAFQAARTIERVSKSAGSSWKRLLDVEAEIMGPRDAKSDGRLSGYVAPVLSLEQNAARLEKLRPGTAVLGLQLGAGVVNAACIWNDGQSIKQIVVAVAENDLRVAIGRALVPTDHDLGPQRGESGGRSDAWGQVVAKMEPILQAAMGAALGGEPLRWAVIAPGLLGLVPLLGLTVGGRPLSHIAASIVRIPSLAHLAPLPSRSLGREIACGWVDGGEQGETHFGLAAVQGIRAMSEPELVLDDVPYEGNEVMEADALETRSERLGSVRLYSVGDDELHALGASLKLRGSRRWTLLNGTSLWLPRCRSVELWACARGLTAEDALLDRVDGMPELARGFFVAGAEGVLDLAWPIHDVVKALVFEQYWLIASVHGPGPAPLARALKSVGVLLDAWGREAASLNSIQEALQWLDGTRAVAREHFQCDAPLMPFEALAESRLCSGTVASFVEEVCQPVHRAAFRWWGI